MQQLIRTYNNEQELLADTLHRQKNRDEMYDDLDHSGDARAITRTQENQQDIYDTIYMYIQIMIFQKNICISRENNNSYGSSSSINPTEGADQYMRHHNACTGYGERIRSMVVRS